MIPRLENLKFKIHYFPRSVCTLAVPYSHLCNTKLKKSSEIAAVITLYPQYAFLINNIKFKAINAEKILTRPRKPIKID